MQLTWLGHASFKLKTKLGDSQARNEVAMEGKFVYIDPVVDKYGESWRSLEKADLVLVSHWHAGHGSLETINHIRTDSTLIAGSAEASSEIDGCETLAMGEEKMFGGIKVTAIPAYTPRRPEHQERGNVLGFVLEIEGKKIYFASDTGLIPEMQALGAIDAAILPVGGTDTMSAAEAMKAVQLINPKIAIPAHWGSKEGTIDDAESFKEMVETRTKTQVRVLQPGETTEL